MKIAMIGTGYVGLVSGVCFSDFGHEVVCVDKDPRKVEQHIPVMLDPTPPELDGLQYTTVYESRFAGTTFYYVLSAAYGDGI